MAEQRYGYDIQRRSVYIGQFDWGYSKNIGGINSA